jgi:hypothetical protein
MFFLFRTFTMLKLPRNKRAQICADMESFSYLDWNFKGCVWVGDHIMQIFFPKQMSFMHKLIFFPYTPGDGRVEHKADWHVMISFHNFYQDTWIYDLVYFHHWAAVQLMQDVILSLARLLRKYQKDLASSLNTMLCSSEKGEERRSTEEHRDVKLEFYFLCF